MDNTAILAVIEALGDSLAAHKNYEENIREHAEQLHEQNEMLRKEIRELKAQNEAMKKEIEYRVGTSADEDCDSPRICKAEEIPHSPYGVAEACTPLTAADTNECNTETDCEACDG